MQQVSVAFWRLVGFILGRGLSGGDGGFVILSSLLVVQVVAQ